jgi:hypothetical protein
MPLPGIDKLEEPICTRLEKDAGSLDKSPKRVPQELKPAMILLAL